MEALTDFGVIGVKVWIFKGEVLPQAKEQEEDMLPIEVTVTPEEATQDASTEESQVPE